MGWDGAAAKRCFAREGRRLEHLEPQILSCCRRKVVLVFSRVARIDPQDALKSPRATWKAHPRQCGCLLGKTGTPSWEMLKMMHPRPQDLTRITRLAFLPLHQPGLSLHPALQLCDQEAQDVDSRSGEEEDKVLVEAEGLDGASSNTTYRAIILSFSVSLLPSSLVPVIIQL